MRIRRNEKDIDRLSQRIQYRFLHVCRLNLLLAAFGFYPPALTIDFSAKRAGVEETLQVAALIGSAFAPTFKSAQGISDGTISDSSDILVLHDSRLADP
jgi:hypothetical protein